MPILAWIESHLPLLWLISAAVLLVLLAWLVSLQIRLSRLLQRYLALMRGGGDKNLEQVLTEDFQVSLAAIGKAMAKSANLPYQALDPAWRPNPELAKLERFPQVQHLVSTVEGRLRPDVTHFAALASCFPGGSITGAPKIRAMEIIAELEPGVLSELVGPLRTRLKELLDSGDMKAAEIARRRFGIEPGGNAPTSGGKSDERTISLPLKSVITSPAWIPALAAALPGATLATSAPSGRSKPKDCASAWNSAAGSIAAGRAPGGPARRPAARRGPRAPSP